MLIGNGSIASRLLAALVASGEILALVVIGYSLSCGGVSFG